MCENILHNAGLLPMSLWQRFPRAIDPANPLAPSYPLFHTAWTSAPVDGVAASCLHSEPPDVQNTEDFRILHGTLYILVATGCSRQCYRGLCLRTHLVHYCVIWLYRIAPR